jgi:hypothetical protein
MPLPDPFRFDDVIAFDGAKVIAVGPVGAGETIKEVCAWVYQSTDDRQQDAAATEMTTNSVMGEGRELFRQTLGSLAAGTPRRWLLPLNKLVDPNTPDTRPFVGSKPAFAVAVALVRDAQDRDRVIWWGHPIMLVSNPTYVAAADSLITSTKDTQGANSTIDSFGAIDVPATEGPTGT